MLVSDVVTIGHLIGVSDFKKIAHFTSKVSKQSTAFGRVIPVSNDFIRRFDCLDVCILDGKRCRYFKVSKKVFC